MKMDAGDFAKAKKSAYRLIRYRERSSKEIVDRLKEKGFDADICGKVIAELKELGYLDDTNFANAVAEDIIRSRPAGIEFIRQKLRLKGVPADIADSVISDIRNNYDEYSAAYKLASVRAKRLTDIGPDKAKRRIYTFLARRRFSDDVISEVLNRLFSPQWQGALKCPLL
jgi:regulatory protein